MKEVPNLGEPVFSDEDSSSNGDLKKRIESAETDLVTIARNYPLEANRGSDLR